MLGKSEPEADPHDLELAAHAKLIADNTKAHKANHDDINLIADKFSHTIPAIASGLPVVVSSS